MLDVGISLFAAGRALAAILLPLDSSVARADPGSTIQSVGTPLVSAASVSGGRAHFDLVGGTAGDTVFALDNEAAKVSLQTTFSPSGTASVDLPVPADSVSAVEFHVYPKRDQGTVPFVFTAAVNTTSDARYAFRIAAIQLSDSPRTAHVVIDGLLAETTVHIFGLTGEATGEVAANGRTSVDVPLRSGGNRLVVEHETPGGTRQCNFQLDAEQRVDAAPPEVGPAPDAPGVRELDRSTRSIVLAVTGRTGSIVSIAGANGDELPILRMIGTSGRVQVALPTPATSTRYTVRLARDGAVSSPTAVMLGPLAPTP